MNMKQAMIMISSMESLIINELLDNGILPESTGKASYYVNFDWMHSSVDVQIMENSQCGIETYWYYTFDVEQLEDKAALRQLIKQLKESK